MTFRFGSIQSIFRLRFGQNFSDILCTQNIYCSRAKFMCTPCKSASLTMKTLCKLTLYGFRRGWLLFIDLSKHFAACNKNQSLVSDTSRMYVCIVCAASQSENSFVSCESNARDTSTTISCVSRLKSAEENARAHFSFIYL